MPVVRNPLSGFALTILGAVGFSFLAGVPILFLPARELLLFYFPFILFGVGFFSGRATFIGSLGFVGATLGGFVGVYFFQWIFLPSGWLPPTMWPVEATVLLTLAFGATCGVGGLTAGWLGHRRIDRMAEHGPKMRRCPKCGSKVGTAARKCWSCRAYLPPT